MLTLWNNSYRLFQENIKESQNCVGLYTITFLEIIKTIACKGLTGGGSLLAIKVLSSSSLSSLSSLGGVEGLGEAAGVGVEESPFSLGNEGTGEAAAESLFSSSASASIAWRASSECSKGQIGPSSSLAWTLFSGSGEPDLKK